MFSRSSVRVAVLAVATAMAASGAVGATALDLYYERALMNAAQDRCGLFTPTLAAALEAAADQARGAALRAGASDLAVREARSQALQRLDGFACDSRDLKIAADRVRQAFDGWRHVTRMQFPGESAPWTADRTAYRSARWKLVQDSRAGLTPVRFGLAGQGDSSVLLAVAAFAPGQRPYAARLVYRDARRAPAPWLGAPANRPLPPRSASAVVLANDEAGADPNLAPTTHAASIAFRFPASAANALAALDPRERVSVEFIFPGEQVRTAAFEVGDFAAGRAFLRLGG